MVSALFSPIFSRWSKRRAGLSIIPPFVRALAATVAVHFAKRRAPSFSLTVPSARELERILEIYADFPRQDRVLKPPVSSRAARSG